MRIEAHRRDAVFQARGRTIDFPGYRRVCRRFRRPDAELADQERLLPPLVMGDTVNLESLEAIGHQTKAPARLTDVTGQGARSQGDRPSVHLASIIDLILRRKYVFKKVPRWCPPSRPLRDRPDGASPRQSG